VEVRLFPQAANAEVMERRGASCSGNCTDFVAVAFKLPVKPLVFAGQAFHKFRQYPSLTLLIGGVNWPSYTLKGDRQQIQLHRGGS
jgi:hypothetical protein